MPLDWASFAIVFAVIVLLVVADQLGYEVDFDGKVPLVKRKNSEAAQVKVAFRSRTAPAVPHMAHTGPSQSRVSR